MSNEDSPRILRRLLAAEGYLELGMPQHALDELDTVEEAGPFTAPLQFMRGEALRAQERYEDAIKPLQEAAKLIPAPHNKQAWMSLSDCFRHRGQDVLADVVEMFANAPPAAKPELQVNVTFEISPPDDDDGSQAD